MTVFAKGRYSEGEREREEEVVTASFRTKG